MGGRGASAGIGAKQAASTQQTYTAIVDSLSSKELPTLTGTDKQVAYAGSIRDGVVATFNESREYIIGEIKENYEQIDTYNKQLDSETDSGKAKTIQRRIDRRTNAIEDLKDSLKIQKKIQEVLFNQTSSSFWINKAKNAVLPKLSFPGLATDIVMKAELWADDMIRKGTSISSPFGY